MLQDFFQETFSAQSIINDILKLAGNKMCDFVKDTSTGVTLLISLLVCIELPPHHTYKLLFEMFFGLEMPE